MSTFNCTNKIFFISPSSSKIDRFRDALKNGTQRGVSLNQALIELNNIKIKKN